jgi:hypothetical protein
MIIGMFHLLNTEVPLLDRVLGPAAARTFRLSRGLGVFGISTSSNDSERSRMHIQPSPPSFVGLRSTDS